MIGNKLNNVWLAAAIAIGTGFSGLLSEGAEASKPMHITTIEGISEYRLENGLKVLLFPDSSRPTVTVNLTVFVGSRHEGYGEAGMAHLLEHMLFKGTPTHPEIPKVLQGRGAQFNGTTWLDRTNYYETLPASDENLEFAIRLEADRMVNSHVKAEDLATEMTVVRNEFERGENSPGYVLAQRMMAAAFEWHNYGKSTIGNRADIERVPVDNLKAFYRKYYQPDNAMVVIAGRFDEKKALGFLGQYFGALPKPARKLENTYTEEPAQDGEREVRLRRVGDVALVSALYHIPAGAHPDYPAIDLLETMLTLQPSGRLYRQLVEQKKATSVSGSAFALHDPGVLRFSAEVATGNAPEVVLDGLLDTVQTLIDQGATKEEVERARQRLLKQRELSAADTSDLAVELSEWAAQGDWRLYFIYRDRLEKVSVEDVTRVARAYLQPTNRTVGLYLPTEQPQRTVIPETPKLAEMIGDYKGREGISLGEQFDVEPLAIEARTQRMNWGGVQAAFVPKKTRGEAVVLRLTLRYGDEKSLFGTARACEFLGSLMLRGTKKLTRQEIQDAFDQNLAQVTSQSQPGEVTFVVQTKRDSLEKVLSVLKQILREPVFPPEEFEILKRQSLSNLEQAQTDPQTRAVRHVAQQLSPYPAGDVRHVPTVEAELKLTRDVTVGDVKTLYTDFLGAQAASVVVVGDFNAEQLQTTLKEMLAGWSAKQPYGRIVRTGNVATTAGLEKIQIPDKANTFFYAGAAFPMNDAHPDCAALTIGNFVLGASGLSSRLGDRIRQKEGLSYGVGSVIRSSAVDERSTFSVYAICNPNNATKLVAGINEELNRLIESGITEKELQSAVEGYLQKQQVDRTDDLNLTRVIDETIYAQRTLKFNAEWETRIRKLTTAEVSRVLKSQLPIRQLRMVLAGDLSETKE